MIAAGSGSERTAAVDALEALGKETGDPQVWLAYARGLAAVGRPADSVRALQWLVEVVPSEPEFRIELATAHASIGDEQQARQILEALLKESLPEAMWVRALMRLGSLRSTHWAAAADARGRELQRTALRARIASGEGTPEDVVRLADLALEHRADDLSGAALAEAARAIEDALKRSPDHVALLEQLVLIYVLTSDARRDERLRELERVAPDSPLLEAFSGDEGARRDAQAALALLLEQVATGDAVTRAAALADFGARVAQFPGDPERRSAYAMALAIAQQHDEAVEQASAAADLAGESHVIHYNVGQVFLRTGRRKRARRHLELAREYASDAVERADADELLAELGDG